MVWSAEGLLETKKTFRRKITSKNSSRPRKFPRYLVLDPLPQTKFLCTLKISFFAGETLQVMYTWWKIGYVWFNSGNCRVKFVIFEICLSPDFLRVNLKVSQDSVDFLKMNFNKGRKLNIKSLIVQMKNIYKFHKSRTFSFFMFICCSRIIKFAIFSLFLSYFSEIKIDAYYHKDSWEDNQWDNNNINILILWRKNDGIFVIYPAVL